MNYTGVIYHLSRMQAAIDAVRSNSKIEFTPQALDNYFEQITDILNFLDANFETKKKDSEVQESA